MRLGYSLKFAAKTDTGYRREKNEDAFRINEQFGLAVVADGVGGAPAGEIASYLAVNEIESYVIHNAGAEGPLSTLGNACASANDVINKKASRDRSLHGMCTTVVACLVTLEHVFVAHVGDSRAYIVTKSDIRRITNDHSLVAELIRSGNLAPEEAQYHPYRHIITRVLGLGVHAQPELGTFSWHSGSYLLLCSDGLTEAIIDHMIYEAIIENVTDLQDTCVRLVELANAKGGLDNVTIILVEHT
jgi:serine/threonine protein phosphatase PrpC